MRTFLNDVYVRSLADNVDPSHQSVIENLLNNKVDSAFTETLFNLVKKNFFKSHAKIF